MARGYNSVGALHPKKAPFNLSRRNYFDCSWGNLVPAFVTETLPGDVFDLGITVMGRLSSALVAPAFSPIDIVTESFFVPLRLLMGHDANFETPADEPNFEDLLSGGLDGTEVHTVPVFGQSSNGVIGTTKFKLGGIGDYLGIQPNVNISPEDQPTQLVHRGIRWIWNEYYRDENNMPEIQVCKLLDKDDYNTYVKDDDYDTVLQRCWKKDYFTTALPWQQRGTAPALPLTGTGSAVFDWNDRNSLVMSGELGDNTGQVPNGLLTVGPTTEGNRSAFFHYGGVGPERFASLTGFDSSNATTIDARRFLSDTNHIDMSQVGTFSINDLRTAWAVQVWMERNMRAGVRYTEYLQAHFGESPTDARLQRPEYIGGTRQPFIVSEVLQTSETTPDSAQGTQAGQAVSLNRTKIGRYRCYEYGYIITFVSVIPRAMYQQGLPRYLSRKNKLDFYSPEFSHLSEEPILNKELFLTDGDPAVNNQVFGFRGIWDEMRHIPSMVTGHMRSGVEGSFAYYHTARNFGNAPTLNREFLTINGKADNTNPLQRIFAVQGTPEAPVNPFLLACDLHCRAYRPLPPVAEPATLGF